LQKHEPYLVGVKLLAHLPLFFACFVVFLPAIMAQQQPGRVLMIGIDGVRSDALQVAVTPAIDGLISNGFFSPDALNDDITISGPGWSSIHCGVRSGKHNVIDNSFAGQNYVQYPGWLHRVEELHPEWSTLSASQWSPINAQIVGSSADAVVNPSSAAQAAQVVVDALANGNPHAIFVHLDDPDYAGHAFGFSPFVFPYLDSIEEMDALVGLMLDALESREAYTEENWLVLVTTDHGGIGTSHGGNSIEERRVFVIASGESVSPEWVSRDTLSVVGAAENCLGAAPLLSFDGSSRASVPVHADFLPGANGDFTVECRVRTAQGADVSMVGNKDWNSGLNPGWVFSFTYPSGPGWRVNAGDGASRIDLDGPPIADGTWHTLSCSFDRDGMMRMYTDGVLSDEADMSGLADLDVGGLFFGADALGDYGMEGVVSEVRYWSEALDGGVIADWHCSPLTMAHPDWAALRGHWPLDEGVGDFLEDVSGNDHHATNEGGLWDSDGVSVQWDYSATPRLVDVPVMALAHLCVPLEEDWNLDGKPLLGTCFPPLPDPCPEDLNGDGMVTVVDLLLVLGSFGQACTE